MHSQDEKEVQKQFWKQAPRHNGHSSGGMQ